MILATLSAPLLSQGLSLVAFGIGIFPLKDTFDLVRNLTKKHLKLLSTLRASDAPMLDKLQGLTADVIERLAEEGITSSVCLAYADPIKLFLKTNFEWSFLIDIIDQALLFNYLRHVDGGLARIRSCGIRGSIEMTVLGEPLIGTPLSEYYSNPRKGKEAFDPRRVAQAIAIIAKELSLDEKAVRNLAMSLWEDGQVDLIWQLFKAFEDPSDVAEAAAA
jgi:hypothetical protein